MEAQSRRGRSKRRSKVSFLDGVSRVARAAQLMCLLGAGAGNLNAAAAADAEQKGRQMRAAIQDKNAS